MIRIKIGLFALMTLFVGSCTSGPKFSRVQGLLLVGSEPAAKVRVEFHPDASRGTKGPSSFGETDAEGRFTLTYSLNDKSGEGAVVGWHKVVVQDLRLSESETGKGIPLRFGPELGTILTTTLAQEVKDGEQSITVTVPKK